MIMMSIGGAIKNMRSLTNKRLTASNSDHVTKDEVKAIYN